LEYWNERDSDIDADFFTTSTSDTSSSPPQQFCENDWGEKEDVSQDEEAVIWWIVAFTCIFQTLHSLSSRAVSWALNFLGSLLSFCG